MTARKSDGEQVTLSIAEFTEAVRNAPEKSGFKDWTRVAITVLVPLVAMVMYFSKTAFLAEKNCEDINKHEIWIEAQRQDTTAIKNTMAVIKKDQAVILEKISAMQDDVRKSDKDAK